MIQQNYLLKIFSLVVVQLASCYLAVFQPLLANHLDSASAFWLSLDSLANCGSTGTCVSISPVNSPVPDPESARTSSLSAY